MMRKMCRMKATTNMTAYTEGITDIEKKLSVGKLIKTVRKVDALAKLILTDQ